MIAAGGLSGGLGSYVTGGSFWEGVRQGVISSSLNHALHGTFEAGQVPPEKGDRRMPQRGYGFEEVYNGTSWVADWNGKFYHASGQVTSTGSPFELLLGSGIASSAVKVLTAAKTSTTVFQKHHIIPNQVFKSFKTELNAMGWKQNNMWNLKKLPTPFHGNHPAYNSYIMNEMNLLKQSGNLNLNSMQNLQHNMRLMIGDAYRSGGTLNQYFKF
jgi:hypothetical protein